MAGKVIVITGANGGLGQALSTKFAADGETVVLLGRSLAKVQAVADTLGAPAMAVECDVSKPHSVRAAFATIAATHPTIDVLINNAAAIGPYLIADATDDQIMAQLLTNLGGPIFCARSAIPMLKKGSMIINISSDSVVDALPHLLVYQASKAGLECFSRDLHLELKDQGVRVTTVRAGPMTGPGANVQMDPAAAQAFFMAAMARGINMMTRGVSTYGSTLPLFRALIDLPPDLHVGIIGLNGRNPD